MARNTRWSGTITNGNTETITLTMKLHEAGFQVSVEGTGTVAVATQEVGNDDYVDQTSLTEGSLIFDLQQVNKIQLTASGADMDYVVTLRS